MAAETEGLRLDPSTVEAGVRALLDDVSRGIYFVAELDREVVGQVMITYEWSDWRNGNIWWLQSVYVKEEFRGRGIFRALFNNLKRLADTEGDVCGLRLYMHSENEAARRAYERLGMKATKYQVYELDSLPFRASGSG